MQSSVRRRVTRRPHPHSRRIISQLLADDDGPMGFDYLDFYKRGHREQVAMAFGIDLKSLDDVSPPAQSKTPVSQGGYVLLVLCSADSGGACHRCHRRENTVRYALWSPYEFRRTAVHELRARATPWGLSRGGVLHIMHGRSRMTINPRIPIMPGRSTSGFHRPRRHCLHQARSPVRCAASRSKGELRLLVWWTCMWTTAFMS